MPSQPGGGTFAFHSSPIVLLARICRKNAKSHLAFRPSKPLNMNNGLAGKGGHATTGCLQTAGMRVQNGNTYYVHHSTLFS